MADVVLRFQQDSGGVPEPTDVQRACGFSAAASCTAVATVVDMTVLAVDVANDGVAVLTDYMERLGWVEIATDPTEDREPIVLPVVVAEHTGATYSFVNADKGKLHKFTQACTVTVPNGLEKGWYAMAVCTAASSVLTFDGAATLRNRYGHSGSSGQWGEVALTYLGTNEYLLGGETA